VRELRKDPIVGRWVIISSERAQRPNATPPSTPNTANAAAFCPLCPGNEDKTPGEVLAFRGPGSPPNKPGWSLRVVPNKFPALRVEGELVREGEGIYDRMSGIGAHEVIIETPRHDVSLSDLEVREVEDLLWAFRERMADLRRDGRLRYVLVFKNHGEAAGASLDHAHSQLIAMPIVPDQVREEMDGARRHYTDKERCIFCDIVREEKREQVRIVSEADGVIAIAPWAPRGPFETWVLPERHMSNFEDCSRADLAPVASVLRSTLRKLDRALSKPAYNFMLHTAPLDQRGLAYYHWHIEIMPTLTKVAGFEWGSGCYINPTAPEEAAEYLRKLVV
jgi:UDPglucose--hexose-1-phosphate uridylyltransferase